MSLFTSICKNNLNLALNLGVALEKGLNAVENFFQTQILIKAMNFPNNKEQIKWNEDNQVLTSMLLGEISKDHWT